MNTEAMTTPDGLKAFEIIGPIEWKTPDGGFRRVKATKDEIGEIFGEKLDPSCPYFMPYFPGLMETAALFQMATMEKLDPLGVEIRRDIIYGNLVWAIMNQDGEAWSEQLGDWAIDDLTFYATRLEATIAAVLAKEAELREQHNG